MAALTRRLNILSRCYASYRAKKSAENLPGIYHSYVFAICNNPGWSQDKLARHLCLNKSNVTRHLTFLEENGYIERRVCKNDKREMMVFPTQKMKDILPEIAQITQEWNEQITEGISKEDLAVFMDILERMADKSREIIYGTETQNENCH